MNRSDAKPPTPALKLAPHVVTTSIGDELVLLDLESRRYYGLNDTGARIVGLLDGQTQPQEIAAAVCEEWDIEPDDAYAEVMRLLSELQHEGLVVPG